MIDVHHGQGGRYLVDPVTGVRALVERTCPCESLPAGQDGDVSDENIELEVSDGDAA